MREIKKSDAESFYVGELPVGCRLCIHGKKTVLFVTGLCNHSCYYCPLSEKRKNVDKTWANEVQVLNDSDLIDEVKLCSSGGVGVTGGEPAVRLERTCNYIRLLKQKFGARFHIHMYTSGDLLDEEALKKLEDAGLDELRFHLRDDFTLIERALGHKFDVGAEVPVSADNEERLKELILYLERVGAKFINLNELEMSELGFEKMVEEGHETNTDIFNTVKGSYDAGIRLLEFAALNTANLSVHLCTSAVKNAYQYQRRLHLRAKGMLKPFEKIVDSCSIEKGVVETEDVATVVSFLRLKEKEYYFDAPRKRIDMSVKNAKKAAKKGFKAAIVRVMPTIDSFDVEYEQI